MKRFLSIVMTVCLLLCLLPVAAQAADTSRSYDFQLSVNGQQEITAQPDDLLTVTLVLKRTDKNEAAPMYAMQAELEYDDRFFELVESSIMTGTGVEWRDMARRTGGRAFYLNFLSMSDGAQWASEVLVGSFQLKVIGNAGVSTVASKNCMVSTQTGQASFESVSNDIRVIVGTDCRITFVENGGSEVEDMTVQYGEKIPAFEDPTRSGYTFNGWYSDLDRTHLWDFENDLVRGNMTLYAGWLEGESAVKTDAKDSGEGGANWAILLIVILLLLAALILLMVLLLGKKKVTFETFGGTELDPVYVKKGERIRRPMTPVKPGAMFVGWYRDPDYKLPWDFARNKVSKSMTLYARWR